MILGQSSPPHAAMLAKAARSTLDDVFRRAATRRPDAIALVDPPNRTDFTDGAPRRLTYAQADRMISAIAGRLRMLGLGTDQIVAMQVANTVDAVVTLLGILRAGLIATPLPLAWRQDECVAALGRIGAQALIVSGRIGPVDHRELAMTIAADVFHLRQVCAFGRDLDGIVGLDDLYDSRASAPLPVIERPINPAAHVAVITWDTCAEGAVPVARSHFELLAAGAAIALESRIEQDAVLLTPLALSSLAGLALAVPPWLLTGGTLALHHPFDDEVFMRQCRTERCNMVVAPAPLALQLSDTDAFKGRDGIKTAVAVWRTPERMAASAPWRDPAVALVDVAVFGETAVIAARRGADGRAAPLTVGPVMAPHGAGTLHVAEVARTSAGTIALRGPLVPRFPLPLDVDRVGKPPFAVGTDGYVDTGYPCTVDLTTRTLAISGPPAGVGDGYRAVLRTLADHAEEAEPDRARAVG